MNPVNPNQSEWNWIFQNHSDWIGLTGFIGLKVRIDRIHSNWKFGLTEFIRINSDWFWMGLGLTRIEKSLRFRSEWNYLFRIQIPEWFGKFSIRSEWISIRNFRQGRLELNGIKIFDSQEYLSWRKFRFEIHSEPIRNFPNYSGIYTGTKQCHSDWSDWKFALTEFIRIECSDWPNSIGIVVRINSDLFWMDLGLIRIESSNWPDSFWLNVRIHSD